MLSAQSGAVQFTYRKGVLFCARVVTYAKEAAPISLTTAARAVACRLSLACLFDFLFQIVERGGGKELSQSYVQPVTQLFDRKD